MDYNNDKKTPYSLLTKTSTEGVPVGSLNVITGGRACGKSALTKAYVDAIINGQRIVADEPMASGLAASTIRRVRNFISINKKITTDGKQENKIMTHVNNIAAIVILMCGGHALVAFGIYPLLDMYMGTGSNITPIMLFMFVMWWTGVLFSLTVVFMLTEFLHREHKIKDDNGEYEIPYDLIVISILFSAVAFVGFLIALMLAKSKQIKQRQIDFENKIKGQ